MYFNPQLKLFEKPALSTAVETARLAASSNRSKFRQARLLRNLNIPFSYALSVCQLCAQQAKTPGIASDGVICYPHSGTPLSTRVMPSIRPALATRWQSPKQQPENT
jgi:hypothetical protein